jgi:DNA/RNA endonuclease YhcR with UshA esterase domain
MPIFTTKEYSKLPDADEMRSNGNPVEVIVLHNESGTVELEAVQSQLEEFEQETGVSIGADVIDDGVMDSLVEYLNLNRLLDDPVC